ncbi:MAG: hypothetical protein ACRCWW_07215 [Scandinavium sp.]|uniref:hypothetical protein n=1 Tax=Scandinavium sp. TaxID=2830653 RepID=UPI003F3EC9F9
MTVDHYLKKLRCVKEEHVLEKLIARIEDTLTPGSQATFQKACDRRRAELCDNQFSLNNSYNDFSPSKRY